MKEVVTVQIGSFANFVGSHFWNFQDELLGLSNEQNQEAIFLHPGINMDAIYRVGETQHGVSTYTPRLLSLDSRGSSGAVRASSSLYEGTPSNEATVTAWSGKISKYESERVPKNLFLQTLDEDECFNNASAKANGQVSGNVSSTERRRELERACVQSLEDNVQSWTDYSKVYYHPKSICELQGVWNGLTPFDGFGSGRGLLTEPAQREEIEDRLRYFAEECDHLQGLQLLVDDSAGFSGVGADFLESIVVDDYGTKPLMLFTMRPPTSFGVETGLRGKITQALHDTVSFCKLSSLVHFTVPLGLPSLGQSRVQKYLCVNDSKTFHSSAVYGMAISCMSLPFRMEEAGPSSHMDASGVGSMDMATLMQLLSPRSGKQIAMLSVAIPAQPIPGKQNLKMDDYLGLQPLLPYSPSTDDFGATEALVIQGALKEGSNDRASVSEVIENTNNSQKGAKQRRENRLLSVSGCPLPIPLPFPSIFGPSVGPRWELSSSLLNQPPGRGGLDIFSVPLAAKLEVSASIMPYLQTRLDSLKEYSLSRASAGKQVLLSWGFEENDTLEMAEHLAEMLLAYRGGNDRAESESDSD